MMAGYTADQSIKASRKRRVCDWCAEVIEVGKPYIRWRWFGGDTPATVRVHPECKDALGEEADECGGVIEFTPGDNPRGRVAA